ncbi:MAG: extracellular solute-binding protein [Actinomycetota bacterium]|nr:extracellular solute-binding protein [Actinomycetota bacterium]
MTLLTAAALVAGACSGGSDDEATPTTTKDSPAQAENCPVEALDSASGVTEVTVWHPYNTLTQEALETAATDYNASQSKVKVSVEAQGSYPELLKKYEDSLGDPANLPDVIFSEDTTLQYMVDSGSVVAAADCIAADPDSESFYGDLLPQVANSYSVGGKLWAAAFGVSMPVMYVNNDHLAAASLTPDDYPGTLEEVRAVAEKIKAANIAGLEAPVVMQLYGWFPENWLTGARQEIVNEENGRAALATESEFGGDLSLEVLEWMNQMEEDGLLKAYPYNSDISHFLAMAQSSASILIDGSRAITTVDAVVSSSYAPTEGDGIEGVEALEGAELDGLDISVTEVPGIDEPGKGAVWGSAGFLVAGEDDAEVAGGWDFLKFFNAPAQQVQWTLKGSYLPVTETVQDSPEITSYFAGENATGNAGKWLGVVNGQLLNLDTDFASPAIGPYNEFRAGEHSMLDDVVLGDADPAEALETFNSKFQDDLDRYAAEVGG